MGTSAQKPEGRARETVKLWGRAFWSEGKASAKPLSEGMSRVFQAQEGGGKKVGNGERKGSRRD